MIQPPKIMKKPSLHLLLEHNSPSEFSTIDLNAVRTEEMGDLEHITATASL